MSPILTTFRFFSLLLTRSWYFSNFSLFGSPPQSYTQFDSFLFPYEFDIFTYMKCQYPNIFCDLCFPEQFVLTPFDYNDESMAVTRIKVSQSCPLLYSFEACLYIPSLCGFPFHLFFAEVASADCFLFVFVSISFHIYVICPDALVLICDNEGFSLSF